MYWGKQRKIPQQKRLQKPTQFNKWNDQFGDYRGNNAKTQACYTKDFSQHLPNKTPA